MISQLQGLLGRWEQLNPQKVLQGLLRSPLTTPGPLNLGLDLGIFLLKKKKKLKAREQVVG